MSGSCPAIRARRMPVESRGQGQRPPREARERRDKRPASTTNDTVLSGDAPVHRGRSPPRTRAAVHKRAEKQKRAGGGSSVRHRRGIGERPGRQPGTLTTRAEVALAGIDEERLDDDAKKPAGAGGTVTAVPLDVSDADSSAATADRAA
ncbi:hypothetical protein GCM10010385_67380 [Streptomyces geysiriensis]|nr:hypothetical protein GCM10010385_67380 [Streptomyces geysiriensis]GHB93609.1 hypothetical protein GCM10010308_00120 [Streptomyces vinaceusdrappus]